MFFQLPNLSHVRAEMQLGDNLRMSEENICSLKVTSCYTSYILGLYVEYERETK